MRLTFGAIHAGMVLAGDTTATLDDVEDQLVRMIDKVTAPGRATRPTRG